VPTFNASASPLVLVVDDDPATVYAARALLARLGCRVEAAFKGIDAVARARAGRVDAVLLDLQMPEVDGLSVLAELRRLEVPPRVVLMAQGAHPGGREAVRRGEALAVLPKPVDFVHAHCLITGIVPELPIALKLDPSRAAYPTVNDALEGKPLQLVHESPLPPGTPVTVLVPHGHRKPVALSGTAEAAAGGKHLQVRLAALTPETRGALIDLIRGSGAPVAVVHPRPPSRKTATGKVSRGRAAELYQRGMRRLEQGKYAQALQDLAGANDLAENKPEYASAEKRAQQMAGAARARTLIRKARGLTHEAPAEALALFEEALRLEPARASTHLEAAQLLLQMNEDLALAEERLGAAVHLAPSDPVPRAQLARLLERTGRHQEALWACDAALSLFPGDGELQGLASRLQRRLAAAPAVAAPGAARRAIVPS
jgi:CheY-like chemotaxis protein